MLQDIRVQSAAYAPDGSERLTGQFQSAGFYNTETGTYALPGTLSYDFFGKGELTRDEWIRGHEFSTAWGRWKQALDAGRVTRASNPEPPYPTRYMEQIRAWRPSSTAKANVNGFAAVVSPVAAALPLGDMPAPVPVNPTPVLATTQPTLPAVRPKPASAARAAAVGAGVGAAAVALVKLLTGHPRRRKK